MAIDCWDNPLFREIHGRLGSHVEYRQIDLYRLTPEGIGRFDYRDATRRRKIEHSP
jgi:hypothetical protein